MKQTFVQLSKMIFEAKICHKSGMKVLSVRQGGNRYGLFLDWNSACHHVKLYDATIVCTIPLGFVQTKELLSDDDGGNHVMPYKPKWRPPGNSSIHTAH